MFNHRQIVTLWLGWAVVVGLLIFRPMLGLNNDRLHLVGWWAAWTTKDHMVHRLYAQRGITFSGFTVDWETQVIFVAGSALTTALACVTLGRRAV